MSIENEDYKEIEHDTGDVQDQTRNIFFYSILTIVTLGAIIWAIVSLSNYYKNIL